MSSRGTRQQERPPHLTPKGSKGRWYASLGKNWVLKSVLTGALALSAGLYLGNPSVETAFDYLRPVGQDSYWNSQREEVKDAFVTSWDAYAKYAWGKLTPAFAASSISRPARRSICLKKLDAG